MSMDREAERKVVRGYWELAEAAHYGSMRRYVDELSEHLARCRTLVGSDEHVCHVCAVRSHDEDGYSLDHTFLVWTDKIAFCERHVAEFDAHVAASRVESVESAGTRDRPR